MLNNRVLSALHHSGGSAPKSNSSPGDLDLLDGGSIHDFCAAFSERSSRDRVSINFKALRIRLELLRAEHGMRRAVRSVASIAIDPSSEPQSRLVTALRTASWEPDAIDFRLAIASQRPGSGPHAGKAMSSLAPRISYAIAAQERFARPSDLVVISHDFAIAQALLDFSARVEGSRCTIAFFRSFADPRWLGTFPSRRSAGGLQFLDLEPYAVELLGIPWPTDAGHVIGRSPSVF